MTSRILYKPGETSSPEYASWHGMKSRCLNPTDKSFAGYARAAKMEADNAR